MKTLLMMKTRSLISPMVQKFSSPVKPTTITQRRGIRSTGGYRIYKVLNP